MKLVELPRSFEDRICRIMSEFNERYKGAEVKEVRGTEQKWFRRVFAADPSQAESECHEELLDWNRIV